MEQNRLKFPLKSHRKTISIPDHSVLLAEFMGIVFGDGGINNNWQLVISLNSKSDLDYSKHVIELIKLLFNLEVSVRKRPKQNTLVIVCSSTNLLEFLIKNGAVMGNKIKQQFDIPGWIKGNLGYEKAFIRGMVDTDGCLYTHQHVVGGRTYKNIGFCFVSASPPLLKSIATIFESVGIIPHPTRRGNSIYLYSCKAVLEYLGTFGSSNPRIFKKYANWRDARVVE